MQASDIRATSTADLTRAFGWEGNEAMQQHDVHELNRILFDTLEKAVAGTEYDAVINELFYGDLNNVITCDECGESRVRQDRFLDLGLQVKDIKGVNESLQQLFTFEEFNGDNQLTCESAKCGGKKTDSRKGQEIGRLPPVLTLCLYRFELDYETWQRKKLNDKFEYPLELDMSKYMSAEAVSKITDPEDLKYELKSIVIHRGGAYGGHYFAYIKDDLGQGNWHLQKQESFDDAPEEIKRKKFDMKNFMSDKEKKELADEKNKNNPNYKQQDADDKKMNAK